MSKTLLILLAVAGFLYMSRMEYDMAVEEAAVEEEVRRSFDLAMTADSLGLEGQAWLDFVNRED